MTTSPILTDTEILMIAQKTRALESVEGGYILPAVFARAIERAVLQSPEMQRLRDIEAKAEMIVSRCGEDGNYLVLTADLDRLRAAMEQKK